MRKPNCGTDNTRKHSQSIFLKNKPITGLVFSINDDNQDILRLQWWFRCQHNLAWCFFTLKTYIMWLKIGKTVIGRSFIAMETMLTVSEGKRWNLNTSVQRVSDVNCGVSGSFTASFERDSWWVLGSAARHYFHGLSTHQLI